MVKKEDVWEMHDDMYALQGDIKWMRKLAQQMLEMADQHEARLKTLQAQYEKLKGLAEE